MIRKDICQRILLYSLGGGVSKKCPKPPPNHTSSVRVHRAMEVVTELKTVFFIVSPKPVYIGCLQRLVLGDFQLLYWYRSFHYGHITVMPKYYPTQITDHRWRSKLDRKKQHNLHIPNTLADMRTIIHSVNVSTYIYIILLPKVVCYQIIIKSGYFSKSKKTPWFYHLEYCNCYAWIPCVTNALFPEKNS